MDTTELEASIREALYREVNFYGHGTRADRALRHVLNLHYPMPGLKEFCNECVAEEPPNETRGAWPCNTIKAIAEVLEVPLDERP
ncbi:hypothetical protein [Saccharopolyspora mangrovi]|uniref:Uncharacterized protein n=1 Tax=Saccharopolyspora mangrovi TaxID=3082379 RepID=A0ABU6A748_9PSEU|nr:hypothetical protein [Saccharopolyspora sp. S2-29]MEB3367389.1 hypothetical protein [Saccharopolyspora sp. S2-29]